MNKSQLYYFTHKVHKKLEDPNTTVKFMRWPGTDGAYWHDTKVLGLTPNGEVISTLIHEMLHCFHPFWTEKKVVRYERLIIKMLSHKQLSKLTLALGRALMRTHYKKK